MIHEEDIGPQQLYAWHVNIPYVLCKEVERRLIVTGEKKRRFTERAMRMLLDADCRQSKACFRREVDICNAD